MNSKPNPKGDDHNPSKLMRLIVPALVLIAFAIIAYFAFSLFGIGNSAFVYDDV